MKMRRILLCLASTLVCSALFASNSIKDREISDVYQESTGSSDVFDSGKTLNLNGKFAIDSTVQVSEVKAQVSDVDENGNRSIRYVAAITSLDVNASFIRTMYNEDESLDLVENELPVTVAFSSIEANGEEILPSSFGEEFKYFITYTLQNIPEESWYNRLDVKVKVNEQVAEKSANVEGLIPLDPRLGFDKSGNGYRAYSIEDISGDLIIPDEYKTIEGAVATRAGDVVDVRLDGNKNLTSVSLPSSITTFSNEAFRNCSSLESLTLPYNLTTIGTNAFVGMTLLNTIYYEAREITSCNSSFEPNPQNVIISKGVEVVSSHIFNEADPIENIEFKGTEEELANITLPTFGPLFNQGIKSEGAVEYSAVFHFEGASLKLSDGSIINDSYTLSGYYNTKVSIPGEPTKDGFEFVGWFEDEACTIEASIKWNTKLTSNIDYYAGFEEKVSGALGQTIDSAIALSDGYEDSDIRTTTAEFPYVYYIFTPTVTDIYYMEELLGEFDAKILMYNDVSKVETTGTLEENDNLVGTTPGLGYKLEANTQYYYKIGSTKAFGNLKVSFERHSGDTKDEAIIVNLNETINAKAYPGCEMYYKFNLEAGMTLTIEPFYIGNGKKIAPTLILYKNDSKIFTKYFKKYTTSVKQTTITQTIDESGEYVLQIYYWTGSSYTSPSKGYANLKDNENNNYSFTLKA